MSDFVFSIIWLGILGYWIYCHVSFRAALKSYEPEMYKENSEYSPLKYSAGFAWIDLALSNKYSRSNSIEVVKSGERLKKAYEAKFKFVGYGLLLSSVWFAFSMFWLSI